MFYQLHSQFHHQPGGRGYLCRTNYTVSLTTKTINIKMAYTVVAKVSTLVRNKVTKTVFNPKHNC